ncbi:hypothetical protein EXIGLDRAFT_752175 [Exidia glandulosa HHB12029]|uniref:F-box domain-containing protein n=1 Tax=Exidia glandulosa HHB12029 TaxID=1314781 RepID=A0A165ERX9_EXIGL|nr:hypothetical protein EXIGLDRAFT_752175 [Exidia glandulosa HHB12029]
MSFLQDLEIERRKFMSELDPNRYAGPAEAALLREDIETHEATRVALDDRVGRATTVLHNTAQALRAAQEAHSSAQQLLDHTTQLKASFEQRLTVSRGLLHPIRRLPNEILAMIFVSVTSTDWVAKDVRGPPFIIAATCRRWRAVALNTPQVWTRVAYHLKDISDSAADRRAAACLRAHVLRSSGSPLEVAIVYWVSPLTGSAHLWGAISALLEQARTFVFRAGVDTTSHFSRFLSVTSPYLQHLSISDGDADLDGVGLFRIALDAPRLTALDCCGSSILWDRTASCPMLGNVQLDVEGFSMQSMIDLFRTSPVIVTLNVGVLENLVAAEPFTLLAEHLETLVLDDLVGPMDLNVARSFSFPSLREAKISISDPHEFEADVIAAFMQSALPAVKTLRLVLSSKLGPAIGLRNCVQLQHLTLVSNFSTSDDPLELLAALSIPGLDGSWLCPRLETLSLSLFFTSGAEDAIVNLATARRCGAPSNPQTFLKTIHMSSYGLLDNIVAFRKRVNSILAS